MLEAYNDVAKGSTCKAHRMKICKTSNNQVEEFKSVLIKEEEVRPIMQQFQGRVELFPYQWNTKGIYVAWLVLAVKVCSVLVEPRIVVSPNICLANSNRVAKR